MSSEPNPSTTRAGPGVRGMARGGGEPLGDEHERLRVALVGIDEELGADLRALLGEENCEVVTPADTADLLARAGESALDLVLIDLDAMGAAPGPLTAQIKAAAPQTMVMPFSRASSANVAIEAMRAGAYDFFQKPASSEELRLRLRHALENKRLGAAIARRTRQLAFVNDISNAISASLDLGQVLQTAASAVRAMIDFDLAAAVLRSGSEPTVTVYPLTPDGEALWAEDRTLPAGEPAGGARAPDAGLGGPPSPAEAAGLRRPREGGTVIAEVLADSQPRLFADLEAEGPVRGLECLGGAGMRSLVLLPLVSKGRTIGALLLASRQPGAFSSSQLQALGHVGGHLASAVENAQLYEQLKTLSSQLEQAVEERTREVFEVKQYLENLVMTAGDAIVTVDLDGQITSWNNSAQEILGYTKEEVQGKPLTVVASGEGARDQVAGILAQAREGKITSNVETSWLRKDHKEATVSLTVSPIVDGAQQIAGILAIARDTTERKKLQEELFHSEKLASIGQLAAGVAHQINNPLGAISGRAQMLLRLTGPLDEEFLKEQLGKVQADCARITETVNDLLGFARKSETVKQYTDVNTIIEETLEMVKHEIIANKVRIVSRLAENLPPVVASANHLRQLVANLMTNAFDAMDTGGTLTVRTAFRPATAERREQVVELSCSDTGCGIAEEELPRIFEPFYTTKPAGEGTGLGLAVAKRIVDFHGGSIDVESALGVGTTFTIQFPVE